MIQHNGNSVAIRFSEVLMCFCLRFVRPPLIIFSVDGFRASYMKKGSKVMPNIEKLSKSFSYGVLICNPWTAQSPLSYGLWDPCTCGLKCMLLFEVQKWRERVPLVDKMSFHTWGDFWWFSCSNIWISVSRVLWHTLTLHEARVSNKNFSQLVHFGHCKYFLKWCGSKGLVSFWNDSKGGF